MKLFNILILLCFLSSCQSKPSSDNNSELSLSTELDSDRSISVDLNFDPTEIFSDKAEITINARTESGNPAKACSSQDDNCGPDNDVFFKKTFSFEDFETNRSFSFTVPAGTERGIQVSVWGLANDDCNTTSSNKSLNAATEESLVFTGEFYQTEMACILE